MTTTTATEIYSHRALKRNVKNIQYGNERQSITNTHCFTDGRDVGACESEKKSVGGRDRHAAAKHLFLCVPTILQQSLSLSLCFMEKWWPHNRIIDYRWCSQHLHHSPPHSLVAFYIEVIANHWFFVLVARPIPDIPFHFVGNFVVSLPYNVVFWWMLFLRCFRRWSHFLVFRVWERNKARKTFPSHNSVEKIYSPWIHSNAISSLWCKTPDMLERR